MQAASMFRTFALILAVTAPLAVRAEPGKAASGHAAWHECLRDAYALRASLTGEDLAADAALRACRGVETAYLASLSASPLLDDEDVARVRPALVLRARDWLTGRRTRPT